MTRRRFIVACFSVVTSFLLLVQAGRIWFRRFRGSKEMKNAEIAYKSFCKERFPSPSETDVCNLEDKLRISLPPDYRQYLLKYNGGFFNEPDIIPPRKGPPLDCLTYMHGIRATHPIAEIGSNVSLFDDNMPPQILPIGYTLMGNLILLITHPEDRGCILLKKASIDEFSHESWLLARGIDEFFALLREPKDE